MDKILIIGSGGREHALGWKLSESDNVEKVYYAPGNGGTQENKGINIPIDGTKKDNFDKMFQFIKKEKIDMVIVGPEIPLADGIVDFLCEQKYNRVFGPSKKASLLESDKFFSYDLMEKLNIPQANSIKCSTLEDAIKAINRLETEKVVIKARGLTAGKGVSVCDSREQALEELKSHTNKYGNDVLIAERLYGDEFSVFGVSDGTKVYPFDIAFKDHKRLLDNNKGPNTGGMGAYGPVKIITKNIIMKICKNILTTIVQELKQLGIIYKGFIYAGMIMTEEGPKVLEFNVRFGDPECQPAMMMLEDLYSIIYSVVHETGNASIKTKTGGACCVVLAAPGYPGVYKKGMPVCGLDKIDQNVKVFHAGTLREKNNIISNGGRILGVTSYSNNTKNARDIVYNAISKIKIPGGFVFRTDIGNS